MINVNVTGAVELMQKFQAASAAAVPATEQAVKQVGSQVVQKVKGEYLSGKALKARTGALRDSVHGETTVSGNEVTFTIGANTPYAAIYEKGGTIPAHTIYPRNGSVLRFMAGGSEVFSRYANIPARTVTPRPYLQPAVDELQGAFETAIEQAVTKELK